MTRRLAGAVLTVRPRAVLRDHTLWVHGDLEPFTSLGMHLPQTASTERVRQVRSVLRLHSVTTSPRYLGPTSPTRTAVVLSALQEDPHLTVHLPERVYGELHRRSVELGDRLTDYAGMLLGAAADRLAPKTYDCSCRSSLDAYFSRGEDDRWRDESLRCDESTGEVLRFGSSSS